MCTVLQPREEDDDDEDDEEEKDGEKDGSKEKTSEEEEHPRFVTDKGFSITQGGMDRFIEINDEIDKRDQDCHNMYIYND